MSYEASVPNAAEIEELAKNLVTLATASGLVLTIEQVSLQPLAMGRYSTRVEVRPARKLEQPNIDTGDHVYHAPSGETWVVAGVLADVLYACGWPCTSVPVETCTLVKKATRKEKELLQISLSTIADRSDPRARFGVSPKEGISRFGVSTPVTSVYDERFNSHTPQPLPDDPL